MLVSYVELGRNLVGVYEDILLAFSYNYNSLRFLFFVTLWLRGDPAVSSSRTTTMTTTEESHRRACSNVVCKSRE